ncbi:MAG: hypothetical protein J1E64_02650 [Acetatifactor sp.]|nr:hypothetical protein [Acetatifactor sp.]
MAKKFGKFLVFTAAAGAAAAAVAYYLQKKDVLNLADRFGDEDYDDFSEDLDEESETSRNYVPLNPSSKQDSEAADNADNFTPLADKVSTVVPKKAEETIEEFFDEDDASEEDSLLGEGK